MFKADLLVILSWLGLITHELFHSFLQNGALFMSIVASTFAVVVHIKNIRKKKK